MPDNLKKKRPQDIKRININEEWEVKYWCEELGCTKEELKKAVEKVGDSVEKVKKELKK